MGFTSNSITVSLKLGGAVFFGFKHRFYDALARLTEANYGSSVLNYGYDVAGNMVDFDGTTRTFNEANQMTNNGTNTLTYDNNGNLRSVGSDTYTWDRANRLLSVGNHSYKYDGLGNRVQQTVSSVVTDYLNDVQPGLTKLLKQDDGTNIEQFVHAPRGIHAVDDGTDWNFYAQDGLGSVRALVNDVGVVQSSMSYDPYGMPLGTTPDNFGFTGEQTDANGAVFLRARYYEPQLGIFSALDPWEGISNRPMSLNGYSWVEGNVPNMVDPSGAIARSVSLSTNLVQQMTQAMKSALTLPFNPLIIKNINSGWCSGDASSRSVLGKGITSFNSRGGSDIRQSSSQLDESYIDQKCGCHMWKHADYSYNACVTSLTNPGIATGVEYCDGTTPSCCGPDITEWLRREMIRHMSYGNSTDIRANDLGIGGIDVLSRLVIYGLAVDYGAINYRNLAELSAQIEGATSPTNIVSNSCNGIVSVCGRCQNSTDFGNFILGAVINAAGWNSAIAAAAGPIFNTLSGDTSAGADNVGVNIGYQFAANHSGSILDSQSFCDSLLSMGDDWLDSVSSNCSNLPACSSSNLNCALNSTAHWNTFVSNSLGNSEGFATPLEWAQSLGLDLVETAFELLPN